MTATAAHKPPIAVDDLIPQTREGASEDGPDCYWLGPNGEIEPAVFFHGDLLLWEYEAKGYKLMQDKRQL